MTEDAAWPKQPDFYGANLFRPKRMNGAGLGRGDLRALLRGSEHLSKLNKIDILAIPVVVQGPQSCPQIRVIGLCGLVAGASAKTQGK